jgi:hypothetical protein
VGLFYFRANFGIVSVSPTMGGGCDAAS